MSHKNTNCSGLQLFLLRTEREKKLIIIRMVRSFPFKKMLCVHNPPHKENGGRGGGGRRTMYPEGEKTRQVDEDACGRQIFSGYSFFRYDIRADLAS